MRCVLCLQYQLPKSKWQCHIQKSLATLPVLIHVDNFWRRAEINKYIYTQVIQPIFHPPPFAMSCKRIRTVSLMLYLPLFVFVLVFVLLFRGMHSLSLLSIGALLPYLWRCLTKANANICHLDNELTVGSKRRCRWQLSADGLSTLTPRQEEIVSLVSERFSASATWHANKATASNHNIIRILYLIFYR